MHKMISFLIVFLLSSFHVDLMAQSDSTYMEGCIKGYENSELVIQEFYGNQHSFVDTLYTDSTGCFTFFPGAEKASGQLRLLLNKRQFLDFFYEKQSISFEADFDHLLASMVIREDENNRLYYDYLNFRASNEYKLNELRDMLAKSQEPGLSKDIVNEMNHLRNKETLYIRDFNHQNPKSLVTKVVMTDLISAQLLDPDSSGYSNYLVKHFLDELDFNDTILLRTNTLSVKLISYLSLAIKNTDNYDSTVARLSQSADQLLNRSMVNEVMFNFIKDYLINGFSTLGYKDLAIKVRAVTFRHARSGEENGTE